MKQERKGLPILATIAVLMAVAALVTLERQDGPAAPSRDGGDSAAASDPHLRDRHYFHPRPGTASDFLNPSDASLQVKGVAASRHVPAPDVRRLMEEHTEGLGRESLGRQRISVAAMNQALDERWPIK